MTTMYATFRHGADSVRAVVDRVDEILAASYPEAVTCGVTGDDTISRPALHAQSNSATSTAGSSLAATALRGTPRESAGGDDPIHLQGCAASSHPDRVLRRLGSLTRTPTETCRETLVDAIPPDSRTRWEFALARHGQQVCTEEEPRCNDCPLISFCETGRSRNTADATAATAVDLFSGAGALALGFEQAGFRILAAVETDRNAAQTYRLNHPGVPVLEAFVEDIDGDTLRSWIPSLRAPEAVIAGPPCQGYSAAGARSTNDQRNRLFRHVGRLARQLDACSVVIENVPGLRRVNGVNYTEKITASLRRAGFRTWKQPVELRASEFGVSQNRRRLFFVGVRRGLELPRPPTPTHAAPDDSTADPKLPKTRMLSERLQDLPVLGAGQGSERLRLPDGRVVLNSQTMKHSDGVVDKIRAIPPGGGPISYRRLEGDIARTLVAGHRALPVHPSQDRTITVREAARIQGFPDSYFFCGPRSTQPLQVANAVPPALSQAVARELLVSLERQ